MPLNIFCVCFSLNLSSFINIWVLSKLYSFGFQLVDRFSSRPVSWVPLRTCVMSVCPRSSPCSRPTSEATSWGNLTRSFRIRGNSREVTNHFAAKISSLLFNRNHTRNAPWQITLGLNVVQSGLEVRGIETRECLKSQCYDDLRRFRFGLFCVPQNLLL